MTAKISLIFLIILIVFTSLNSGATAQDDQTERTTLNGKVKGRIQVSRNGREFYSFEGIPYAKPPVRFMPSEDPDNWDGVRNATVPGDVCIQFDPINRVYKGSEDCLFLNIYIPKVESGNDTDLLPVMVWIHGGGYKSGAGSNFGPQYFMDEDVILVTINYRLAVFGFLNTGDDVVPGNLGLKDMIKALHWLQRNIELFGGNSEAVTIFGESAGGEAAHALMISPAAKGLFQQVIAQSGIMLSPWSMKADMSENNQVYFKNVGCPSQNTSTAQIVECLRAKPARDLLEVQPAMVVPALPSIDSKAPDPVLPDIPEKLLLSDVNSAGVNFIVGYNEMEWVGDALSALRNEETVRNLNENWPETINLLLENFLKPALAPCRNLTEVANQIRPLYFSQSPITSANWTELTTLMSDFFFVWGAKRAAVLHASERGALVFPYILTYRGNFSLVDNNNSPPHGPVHADELQYLFNSLLAPLQNWPDFERGSGDDEFSKKLVSMWASFAKTGAPVSWGTKWKSVDADAFDGDENPALLWFNIGEEPKDDLEAAVMRQRMGFWNEVLVKSSSRPAAGIPSCILLLLSSVFMLLGL